MALLKAKKGPSFAEIQAARNVTPERMALMRRGMSRRYVEQLIARAKQIRRHYGLST